MPWWYIQGATVRGWFRFSSALHKHIHQAWKIKKKNTMYHNIEPIVLASGSPRRRQYLEEMGLTFTVRTVSVEECPRENENSASFVLRMATEKAAAVSVECPDSWVISGDTVVCLDDRILGKPVDEAEAVALLMALSGREHFVKTGFCVTHGARGIRMAELVSTKVRFAEFSESIAAAYVATGESLDKAGAYGIQGKGIFLVKTIEGSYSNVVGLPLYELMAVLQVYGVIEPAVFVA